MDPNDVRLMKGAAYYANEDEYALFLRQMKGSPLHGQVNLKTYSIDDVKTLNI